MFVTSIDVEEGMKVKKRKKNRESAWEEYQGQDGNGPVEEAGEGDPSYSKMERAWSSYRKIERWEELSVGCVVGWWVSIALFNPHCFAPSFRSSLISPSHPIIYWCQLVLKYILITPQALAINPTTYTPEHLLTLARLVSMSQPDDTVVVQPIPRPGTNTISFGGVVDGVEMEQGAGEETFSWKDIVNGEWRYAQD
jgi:hypothetical protein